MPGSLGGDEIRAIAGGPDSLGEVQNPLAVMQRVVDETLALMAPAGGAAVELAGPGGLTYAAAAGCLAGSVGERLSVHDSLSGLAVRTRSVLRCDDSEHDPRVDRAACRRVGARSMVCVPLTRGDHAVGVLKVSSGRAAAFDDRHVATLRRLAEVVAFVIDAAACVSGAIDAALGDGTGRDDAAISRFVTRVLVPAASRDAKARDEVRRVIEERLFFPVFQPIVDLVAGRTVAVEALTRFTATPPRPPDRWFADAHAVGLGVELELAVLDAALDHVEQLPAGCRMAINLSSVAIVHPDLGRLLDRVDAARLTIEITENVAVDDYAHLRQQLSAHRRRGVVLAVDDTGAGFSSFAHIIQLAPDIIKLDMNLTRGVDTDPVRRSLARAVVAFAADTGSAVVAEGIETGAELEMLRSLDIGFGQGYLIGRPAPLADLRPLHLADGAPVPTVTIRPG